MVLSSRSWDVLLRWRSTSFRARIWHQYATSLSLYALWLTASGGTHHLNSTLLTISVISVLLPAVFHFVVDPSHSMTAEGNVILAISRAVRFHES
jgi:hypothetical protein